MLPRDFLDPDDLILNWETVFRTEGRISRRAYWRISSAVARWTCGIALLATALIASVGAAINGVIGLLVGVAIGIFLSGLFQGVTSTALMVQRLHDIGWSAKVLVALYCVIFGSLLSFGAGIAMNAPELEPNLAWLFGCFFLGVAAQIVLGLYLHVVDGVAEKNRFGPPPGA